MAGSAKLYQSCTWVKVACFGLCWFMITSSSQPLDNVLRAGEVLRDWESLSSSSGSCKLSFFRTYLSSNIYLGIHAAVAAGENRIVWVANRDNPVSDSSGVLRLTTNGTLMINSTNDPPIILYSGYGGLSGAGNLNLTLLETGNLILTDREEVIWQSFDYPTDTWLPGMKLGIFNLKSGQPQQQSLVSWLTPSAATSGAFTLGVDPNNTKQLVISQRGTVIWESGVWNGTGFSHLPPHLFYINLGVNNIAPAILFSHVSNENESYFTYQLVPGIRKAVITLNSSGALDISAESIVFSLYGRYSCLDNKKSDWSTGCAVKRSNCPNGDKFVLSTNFNGPFTDYNSSIIYGIYDCKEMCRKKCTCVIYSSYNQDGTGCLFSYDASARSGRFLDSVQSVYIRQKKKEISLAVIISIPSVCFVILILFIQFYFLHRSKLEEDGNPYDGGLLRNAVRAASDKLWNLRHPELVLEQDSEVPFFSFYDIQYATRNFSIENKLGQGGFGPVYKGKLENGQEIAVKRLSKSSGQGIKEFKNEVLLISKLQHRNLVKLLGCCIHREEKLLIYEYMPNNSLDSFLLDPSKRILLDWEKRFSIIQGIAQGLLYLHKYSRLRIIHRDLKNSNVLLDNDLNPKISDFGTARIFEDNESSANTLRIVGTYGYMSPEYAMDGLFSEKSDVFSYGVMVLEIISGKKNTGFYHRDRFVNLLGYAWALWKEGKGLELMDEELNEETSSTNEVLRCIQIGLLCVQESADDRPTMLDVMSLLSHEIITVPIPKQPAYFLNANAGEEQPSEDPAMCSVNKVTLSDVNGR